MQSYINVRLDGTHARPESWKRRDLPAIQFKRTDDELQGRGVSRVKHWLRKVTAFLFSQVGVGLILGLYTILGATIFISLESAKNVDVDEGVTKLRNEVVSKLWDVTHNYNIIHSEQWELEVDFIVKNYQKSLLPYIKRGYNAEDDDLVWTFPKALMYSLSIYTTIGYGNLTPKTNWGKAVTCFYAVFGIPLLLLYMANIGGLLAKSFLQFYTSVNRCKERIEISRAEREGHVVIDHYGVGRGGRDETLIAQTSQEDHATNLAKWGTNEVTTIPISTCLALFFCYIAFGSLIFSWWEGWDYLDGSYFCFITLFSIGFGDLFPGQNSQYMDSQLILCSIYILLGMGLMSTIFHLTQERFFLAAQKLGDALHLT